MFDQGSHLESGVHGSEVGFLRKRVCGYLSDTAAGWRWKKEGGLFEWSCHTYNAALFDLHA